MPYIEFTDSQKQRAAAVDLEVFLLSRGEKLLREGRDKRLASDHSVTICGNEWYDHAVKEGGGPISFVQRFYGFSYPEAMTCLLNGEQGEIRAAPPKVKEKLECAAEEVVPERQDQPKEAKPPTPKKRRPRQER